ncbi:hypothetical protein BDF19DRAFT_450013 [Syncephalis fuscata]|nr:hypothetical protein BDF19DRAFT_450013 [Syncephalis fuscata]
MDSVQIPDSSCGVCLIQAARYTCPRCNLPYCSLTCYRGEAHLACSEGFYKEQLVTELKNTRANDQERTRMLSFLRQIEEDVPEQAGARKDKHEDGADDVADLANRLKGLEIESASFDAIWDCMTPEERQDFHRVIHADSEEREALLQQVSLYHPWWEMDDNRRPFKSACTGWPSSLQHLPLLENITTAIPSDSLLFNLIPVLYAYVFVCRYLNGDIHEDVVESAIVLMDIAPLIVSKQHTVFSSLDEATLYGYQHIAESNVYKQSTHALATFSNDLVCLFSKSYRALSAALGDIYTILELASHKAASSIRSTDGSFRRKAFLASKKVYFYAVYVNWLMKKDSAKTLLTKCTDSIQIKSSN